MKDAEKKVNITQKEKEAETSANKSGTSEKSEKENPKGSLAPANYLVMAEIIDLLGEEDIMTAVSKFKADNEEKEIAREFITSYIDFLKQIVEIDSKKNLARTDVEIRDLLSHVNAMLKKRNEDLFTTMIIHSTSHYRFIQKRFYTNSKKQSEKK